MRPSPAYWLCGLALGSWLSFLGGCASPHWKQALLRPWKPGELSTSTAGTTGKSKFKKSSKNDKGKASDPFESEVAADTETAATPVPKSPTPASIHPPETVALIERELASFPPEEQARAREALSTVPATDVEAVLNVWKVTLAQADKQVAAAGGWSQQAALKSIADGPSQPPTAPPPFSLGQNNPWQNAANSQPGTIQQTAYSPTGARSAVSTPPDWSTVAGNPPASEYRFPPQGGHAPARDGALSSAADQNWGSAGRSTQQPPQWPHAGTGAQQNSFSQRPPQWSGAPGHAWPAHAAAPLTAADFQAQAAQQRALVQPPAWNHQGGTQARTGYTGTQARTGLDRNWPQATGTSPAHSPPVDPYAFSAGDSTDPGTHTSPRVTATQPRIPPSDIPTLSAIPPAALQRPEAGGPPQSVTRQVAAVDGLQIRPAARFNPKDMMLAPGQRLPGFEHGNSATMPGMTQNSPAVLPQGTQLDNPALLRQLLSQAESTVSQLSPGSESTELTGYIREHVHLRLLYLIAGQTERALQPIPGVASEDQEFWTQVLWGMHNYFDAEQIQNPSDRAAQTVQQFNTAVTRLQSRAPLELKNISLCRKINSFGDYEKFERDTFTPGQQVLLYAEIKNFHSELAADGRYRTLLKSTLQIFKPGPNGELVDERPFPSTEDLCKNQRRDYFHSYLLELPVRINAGPHVLKLVVEDELNHKVATATLNFQVQ